MQVANTVPLGTFGFFAFKVGKPTIGLVSCNPILSVD